MGMALRTRFTGKSSRSRRCLMSSAIPLTTCLTTINSRIVKGVSALKACPTFLHCEKKLQDLPHAKLVNKLGGHEVRLNIHAYQPTEKNYKIYPMQNWSIN